MGWFKNKLSDIFSRNNNNSNNTNEYYSDEQEYDEQYDEYDEDNEYNEYDEDNEYDEYDEDNEYDEYDEDNGYESDGIYLDDPDYEVWDDYPMRGHEFWDTLEAFMENSNYSDAEDYLKNYFRRAEKNVFYYFAMAYFYSQKALGWCGSYEDIQRAKSHIDNASNSCDYETKWPYLIDMIKPSIYQNYYTMKEGKRLVEDLKKEWADLRYRTRYNNMDIYLPQLRNLAQSIQMQLSNVRQGTELLASVKSDLREWENTYSIYQVKKLTQEGNYDEAIKVANQISDPTSQVIAMLRVSSLKLLEMITNGYSSQAEITRQMFVVEDATRRASALATEKDNIGALQNEARDILDKTKKYLNRKTSYGISESEAEYIEVLKGCLEEGGGISAKERRLLDRLARSLGISPERAKEIEGIF